jgi:uncharacterized protein involved in exopolysaccharide biosynthesis
VNRPPRPGEELLTGRQATLRDLLSVVFRRKWIIIGVFLITTAGVAIANLTEPMVYESSARVLVQRGRKESLLDTGNRMLGWEEEVSSEIETIKSRPVTRRAAEIFEGMQAAGEVDTSLRFWDGSINAGVIGESNVIEISYQGPRLETCRPAAEAVTRAYVEYRREATQSPTTFRFFDRSIDSVGRAIDSLETEKRLFLASAGVASPDEETRSLIGIVANARMEHTRARRERVEAEGVLEALLRSRREGGDLDPSLFGLRGVATDAPLNSLLAIRQRKLDLEVKERELAVRLTDRHPELITVRAQLEEVTRQLRAQSQEAVAVVQDAIRVRRTAEDSLGAHVRELETRLASLPGKAITLTDLNWRLGLLRNKYETLARSRVEAEISEGATPEWSVTVLSPASNPIPLNTRDYVRLALAPLLSLIVGLGLAFYFDALDHSIKSPAEAEEHLKLDVLASLPRVEG